MNPLISNHFQELNLDIRQKQSGYSRFMDQKVTPDVLSFVADCILNLPNRDSFAVRDIWDSSYLENNTKAIFGKPAPSDESAFSEYNKFIGQPLKTLAFSKVLNETRSGNTNTYNINNHELLEYISLNERGSLNFLYEYLQKLLTESGFWPHIQSYLNDPTSDNFSTLKERFQRFMIGNTEINGKTEVNRIFPKILNPIAVRNGVPGSEKGRATEHAFNFSDLMYNRTNFRDLNKAKGISRQEAAEVEEQQIEFSDYRITKAMELIKRKYSESEVRDQWANGQATQVHHIFPRASHREFAAYPENLIKLTPEQHYSKAHPNAHTQEVDTNYQLQCLISKADSIQNSLEAGEFIYSVNNFIHLLNSGLGTNIENDTSLEVIKSLLQERQVTV